MIILEMASIGIVVTLGVVILPVIIVEMWGVGSWLVESFCDWLTRD